jgi:hypothetical protein
MTPALRLEKLKRLHGEKKRDIIRVASAPGVPLKQKQQIYACLNHLCQLSAKIYGELSTVPGNYDLLEQAAELDAALLQLRKHVGNQLPTRLSRAA